MQKKHIKLTIDFFSFIIYMNLFQAVFLLVLPPYQKFILNPQVILAGMTAGLSSLIYYLFMIMAIARGPLVLTNSILALYLIVPVTYGLIFWQESLSLVTIAGLVLFLFSIALITNSTYFEQEKEKKIELKWLLFVLIAFACNGATSIISKQVSMLDPASNTEYLLASRFINLVAALLTRGLYRLYCQGKKKDQLPWLPERGFLLLNLAAGASMAVANIIYMDCVGRYASALFFPATQGFGIVLMFFLSRLLFKERLSKKALTGFALVISAIVLISFG